MTPEIAIRHNRRVPRYTSYPTAPHFGSEVDGTIYASWLREMGAGTRTSVYLHVPFCASLCWYCGCHTTVVRSHRPIAEYADLMEREIAIVGELCRPEIGAVHWGGGTPNMLTGEELARLTSALCTRFKFAEDIEIAAELDPRILTEEKVRELAVCGLSRASLGVQDFDARVQRAINRIQPYEMTRDAITWLRAAGIRGINVDLMYGLPYQSVATVLSTVDRAVDLAPDRVALFGYAHVPWMKKHQLLLPEEALPGLEERFEQAEAAAERLAAHGYVRVGLDHFARPDDSMARSLAEGRLRRNFQGYTTDECPALLGFGVSAIGSLPQGYVQNASDFTLYRRAVEEGRLPTARGVALTAEDRLRREVIERLMCDLEVDLAAVARRHGRRPEMFASSLPALVELEKDGIAARTGWRVQVTAEGRPLVRAVCAAFDTYLQQGAGRHSAAV
jgi:oxygen-independent coproporphyrinogen III oxidase